MSGMTKAAAALVFASVCGSASGQSCDGRWLPATAGFDDEIWALTRYQGQLVVAGDFDHVPGVAAKNVARWNGASWSGMNGDTLNSPRALRVFSGDLYAGGVFSSPFAPASGIAKWNGSEWAGLAESLPATPTKPQVLTLGDYLGKMLAAGDIKITSNPLRNGVELRDGQHWQNLGGAFSTGKVTASAVYHGDLYVAGPTLHLATDFQAGSVFRYDGSSWSKVGPNGLEGGSTGIALRVFQDKLIIASSDVRTTGAFSYGPVASWDGTAVARVGQVASVQGVSAMTEYNGDLIIGGSFTNGFGVAANGVVRWNGTNFAPLGQGITGTSATGRRVNCLDVFQGELVVGGDFETAGGMPSPFFARWTDDPTPWVAVNPVSQPVNEGLMLKLAAAAASGYANVSYRWQRNGVDVAEGPGGASPGGGTVSGATGALASPSDGANVTLTISGVQGSDSGDYTIVFSSGCNDATSEPATVGVNTCPGDLNLDGVIDDADFTLFAGAYSVLVCEDPSMPLWCPADLNGDALVDDLDFQQFVVGYNLLVCE